MKFYEVFRIELGLVSAETYYMSFDIPDRPKRKYDKKKEKAVLSIRVPLDLKKRLKEISDEKGYSLAEMMETVLDQYCQHEDKQNSK